MILKLLYILLIILAIMAIQTTKLRNAIVYLGIFSFLCSSCYLFLMAPDVAIAEAIIGCTLSTVLYLVAIKRYRILRIYFCDESDKHYGKEKYLLLNHLTECSSILEVQLDVIDSHKPVKYILAKSSYDVIIEETLNGTINIYTDLSNYLIDNFIQYLKSQNLNHVHYINVPSNSNEDDQ